MPLLRSSKLRLFTALLLVLPFLGLLQSCSAQDKNPLGPRYPISVGGVELSLELALDDESRARGLMYRTELEDTQGMLFVFDADQTLRFWMKNTLIPLSVAYISSSGTIKEIHNMEAKSLLSVNSTYQVKYALELPQGAFERLGIKVGDHLELKNWQALAKTKP